LQQCEHNTLFGFIFLAKPLKPLAYRPWRRGTLAAQDHYLDGWLLSQALRAATAANGGGSEDYSTILLVASCSLRL